MLCVGLVLKTHGHALILGHSTIHHTLKHNVLAMDPASVTVQYNEKYWVYRPPAAGVHGLPRKFLNKLFTLSTSPWEYFS